MEYFTKAIDKYFASWILCDTWPTNHPLDMERFYRFIIAIHHFSRNKINPPLDLNDPRLANYQENERTKFAKILAGTYRNPRTNDEKALKEKIMLAIKQNYPNFDEASAAKLVEGYVKKAMIILDALWAAKRIGFPHIDMQKYEPHLK